MTGRAGTLRLAAGLAFLLLYALPLFAPPASPLADATLVRHDLVTRLFPEVPAWWVLGRLAALVLGAALVASVAPGAGIGLTLARDAVSPGSRAGRTVALLAAIAHVACVPFIGALSPVGQTLYLCWLAVPALVLVATGDTRASSGRAVPRAVWIALGGIVVAWIAVRTPIGTHSPRLADLVDMWRTFTGLSRLVAQHGNFLVDGIDPQLPGVNSTPLFFQGLPLLQILGRAPTLDWVQTANTLWGAVAGLATGALAARVVSPWAAPVATATVLASSFLLLAQMTPCVVFLGSLSASMVGLAFVNVLVSASPASVAAFGAVAGLAATYPAVAPATGVAILVVLWRLATGPRLPASVLATAALSFAAAFLPSVPSPDEFRQMLALYVALDGHAATLQATIFGQTPSLHGVTTGWQSGLRGTLDIPLAALLSPFATSRMALRLWGDALFDPFGASLAAVGVATCVRYARRQRGAALLLAFLAATLVTGFASSTDKPSLYRVFASPVVVALLAAVGFSTMVRAARGVPAPAAALCVALGIGIGGMALFDRVNPRVLERSAPGLILETIAAPERPHAAIVTDPREDHGWQYLGVIAREVPSSPMAVVPVADLETAARGGTTLFFWSPAVEETAGVSATVCRRWPEAVQYVVRDPSGRSSVRGVQIGGGAWTPALPADRWQASRCAGDAPPSS